MGIPKVVLFLVGRHGDVEMLQWCLEQCELVLYDCEGCGKGPSGSTPRDNGWDRVPRDAAAAGHVDMVMFCLDEGYEGWEYTDNIMQAAESERRWNAVVALEKRGHSSTVRVREEAPVAPEGFKHLRNIARATLSVWMEWRRT